MDDPSEARWAGAGAYDDWPFADLRKIVWPRAMVVLAPVERYGDTEKEVHIRPDTRAGVTLGHLLDALSEFYNDPDALSDDDLEQLREAVANDEWDDPGGEFGAERALDNLDQYGEPFAWVDLMGDKFWWEGLDPWAKTDFWSTRKLRPRRQAGNGRADWRKKRLSGKKRLQQSSAQRVRLWHG